MSALSCILPALATLSLVISLALFVFRGLNASSLWVRLVIRLDFAPSLALPIYVISGWRVVWFLTLTWTSEWFLKLRVYFVDLIDMFLLVEIILLCVLLLTPVILTWSFFVLRGRRIRIWWWYVYCLWRWKFLFVWVVCWNRLVAIGCHWGLVASTFWFRVENHFAWVLISLASLASFTFLASILFRRIKLSLSLVNIFRNSILLCYWHFSDLISLVEMTGFNNCFESVINWLMLSEASEFLKITCRNKLLFLSWDGLRHRNGFDRVRSILIFGSPNLSTVIT